MSGRVVHFEIPYDDGDRARAFYADVFGWQLMEWGEGGQEYTIVSTGPTGEQGPTEPGYIGGGMFRRDESMKTPNIVIDVENIEDALKAVGEHGGSTVQERQPVGEMGFAAYFKDSEGNLIGVWETKQA